MAAPDRSPPDTDVAARAQTLLSENGLRSTPVRRAILTVLAGSAEPLDVPALLALLPKHTDAVTVYRTLGTFTKKKLVHRVRGEERSWRYALGHAGEEKTHRHPHFVCESCGKVECLADSTVPTKLTAALKVHSDYRVGYTEVIVHGACAKCR